MRAVATGKGWAEGDGKKAPWEEKRTSLIPPVFSECPLFARAQLVPSVEEAGRQVGVT